MYETLFRTAARTVLFRTAARVAARATGGGMLILALAWLGAAPSQATETVPGALDAEFGVDADGNAVYSVPIDVPPGTGGMQPNLHLVYQSDGADGPLGLGWRLEGLEQIDRCRPTIAQYGFAGRIDFSPTDRFCLDGERLVAIQGIYGADGTVYHTERESHVRVTSFGTCGGGPCWFELVRKDGTVLELGNTADSRALRWQAADVRAWAANAYRDPRGNTLHVVYLQSDGAIYPGLIRYTENDGLVAGREVSFLYSPRSPSTRRYDGGSRVGYLQALTEIRTSVDGQLARSYRLGYDAPLTDLSAPRLTSLTECAGDDTCLPPTTFTWTEPGTSIDFYGFNSPQGFDFGVPELTRGFADVDGDGRDDYCRTVGHSGALFLSCALAHETGFGFYDFNSAQGFDFGVPELPRGFADVNGDGREDFCRTVGHSGALFLSCALAHETGFGYYDFNSVQGIDLGRDTQPRVFVDFDGDGRADFCRATSTDPARLVCTLANDGGFFGGDIASNPYLPFDFGYGNFPRAFVDVDGNGGADFCRAVGVSPNLSLSCASAVGTGIDFYRVSSIPSFDFGIPTYPQQFTDANGDGLVDYCRTVGVPPNLGLSCALSKGSAIGFYDMWSVPGFDLGATAQARAYADMNGDGRSDFCRQVGGSPNLALSCATSREDGFGFYDLWSDATYNFDIGFGPPYPREYAPVMPGGGESFCRFVGIPPNQFLSCTGIPNEGHRIRRVVDGYGQSIEVTYATLDDPSVYTPGAGAIYPQRDVRGGPRRVVAAYTRESVDPNALGAFRYDYSYHYSGARESADGRGWLGFREITRRDHDLGLVTVTRRFQDYPLTGETESDTLHCDPLYGRDPACTAFAAIDRTTRTYQTRAPHPGVTEVLLGEVLREGLEYGTPGTSTRQVFDHDAYGNVIREQRVSSVDGGESFELFVHRQYWNDAARHRLGYVTEVVESRDAAGSDRLSRTTRVYDPETLDGLEHSRWDLDTGLPLTTVARYDDFGNPVEIVEPSGLVRLRTYDAAHQTFLATETMQADPASPLLTTTWTHDARFGEETSRTDPAGTFTRTAYDGFGRVESVQGPHPTTGLPVVLRTETWFTNGTSTLRQVQTPTDWNGDLALRQDTFDALGRIVREDFIGPGGGIRVTKHSSNGNVTARSTLGAPGRFPAYETRRYDSRQRLVEKVDAAGLRTTHTYTAPARTTSVIGAGGASPRTRVVDFVQVDGRTKAGRVSHATGQQIDFHYDALGRLTRAVDADEGDLARRTYDTLGRVTRMWNPEGGEVLLGYDTAGHLATRSTRGGQSLRTYTYDDLGRLLSEVATADGVSETIDYGWDDASRQALGRLATVSSGSAFGYGYHYDLAGRVRYEDVAVRGRDGSFERTYDPAGRPLETVFPDGSSTRHAYDDFDLVLSTDFTEVDGTSRRLVEVTQILHGGRPASLRLGPLDLAFAWTATGRPTRTTAASSALGPVVDETLERIDGRFVDGLVDALMPAESQVFDHGPAGELSSAIGGYGTVIYGYQPDGDIASRGGFVYESTGGRVTRVTQDGGEVFRAQYDEVGRMVERVTPSSTDALRYGVRDRLEAVERDGVEVAAFGYDHRGRRIYKRESGVETFSFGLAYEETVHAGGTQQTRTVRAPHGGFATISRGVAVDQPGYPANGDRFVLTDHLGSVRQAFDGQGQPTSTVDHTPFGEVWNETGPQRFRRGFAGMELDRSTGLLFDNARYYDPFLGRFVTPDTRLGAGSLHFAAWNRYAYAANDPLDYIDPTGHSIFSHAWHWVEHHAKAIEAVAVSATEIAVGAEISPFLPTLGASLIGAGTSGLVYSAMHFNHFSWRGWGASELSGAANAALLVTLDPEGSVFSRKLLGAGLGALDYSLRHTGNASWGGALDEAVRGPAYPYASSLLGANHERHRSDREPTRRNQREADVKISFPDRDHRPDSVRDDPRRGNP